MSKKIKTDVIEIECFSNKLNSFSAQEKKFKKDFKNFLYDNVKFIFSSVKDLQEVEIIQYTPYFNDGEECLFEIQSVSFYSENDDDGEEWNSDFKTTEEQQILKDKLKIFIYNNKELMLFCFGDHKKIMMTEKDFLIVDFDHE